MVDLIQTVLIEAPLKRLGSRDGGTFRTPLEVMTGIKPLRSVYISAKFANSEALHRMIEKTRAIQTMEICNLQNALQEMHKDVGTRVSKNREQQIRRQKKQTNIVSPSFEMGDFVLVRTQKKGHKQSFKCPGPNRIVRILGDTVYIVESLTGEKMETVHAEGLLRYQAEMNEKEESQKLLNHAKHTISNFEIIERLIKISKSGTNQLHVLVEWAGLPDEADYTWLELSQLYPEIPNMLTEFLSETKQTGVVKEALKFLKLE